MNATGSAFPGLTAALPNITTLQSQSIEFTNYFTAGTSCTPARASMVTGLYPTQTAIYVTQNSAAGPNLVPAYDTHSNPIGYPTFGTYLTGQGYGCYWFGKWHLSGDSPDYNAQMATYGFGVGTNPSPNGYPNEGTGGSYATDEHSARALYVNDQEIVQEYANYASSWAKTSTPWMVVVSLVNPHDIASYPNYLLGYCSVPTHPSLKFAPVQPGTSGTPTSVPALYNTTAPLPSVAQCGGMYTGWYIPSNVTSGQPWQSNVANDLSTKPYLQSIYQADFAAVNGSVGGTQSSSNQNGDWGAFLNTYYWLTSCADKLIGNLTTPDQQGTSTPTILGQLALQANLGNVNLSNTVIVFTADHGEYAGAHTLQGKNASSYEEAIHVPLFVYIPGFNPVKNRPRTQMVSSVDLFGMFAAMATNNANSGSTKKWKADNPQLAGREDMISFIDSNLNLNAERILASTDGNFNGMAYIMHTTNEFYPDKKKPTLNFYNENYHVVGLRTGNGQAGQGTARKLVYYYNWGSNQYQFNNSAPPSSAQIVGVLRSPRRSRRDE